MSGLLWVFRIIAVSGTRMHRCLCVQAGTYSSTRTMMNFYRKMPWWSQERSLMVIAHLQVDLGTRSLNPWTLMETTV